jgi:MFS transporter, PAT family, beta-lactamase induction signal transducer AmpG
MFGNLVRALRSRRTAAVSLLSFASGLPLGLVWFAIPDWMRDIGVDIRVVGLFSLAQAPWAFKVLWSPLMDRFVPPFWGRRRGWMAITQIALLGLGLLLAGVGHRPEAIWVVAAIALATGLASASQDIAYNAYMVEVLEKDEQGAVVGVQVAFYRAAMALAGGLAITMAARVGWPIVNLFLALVYVPMLIVTWWAPEPRVAAVPPRSLRDAVWLPFLEILSRPRALEILAFVVMYKIADQLSQALTRPFLIDMGYNADHRGIALATIGLAATIVGSLVGGWITTLAGLGHALWIFGLLQIFSNIGYWAIAWVGAPNLPLMYSATSFELLTSGLGTGAFSVLLIRLTEKRFSATQYALFSSLFALPRVLAGPIAGFAVDAMGWQAFYLSTLVMGIPGLVLLARFVPPGTREPRFEVAEVASQRAVAPAASPSELAVWGVGFGILAGVAGSLIVALMAALDAMRQKRGSAFDFSTAWSTQWQPASIGDWLQLVSIVAFAAASGLVAVAALAARRRNAPLTSPSEVLPDRAGRSSI